MFFRSLQRRATEILLPLTLCLASVSMLLSGCNASTSTTTASAPTATTTAGVATATSAGATTTCPGLDAIIQGVQTRHQTVGFTMSAQPSLVVHGSLATYAPGASESLSGTGFLVSPNDPVTLQLNRSTQSVAIVITDTVTAQATTYAVSACAATSSTMLALTGTAPTSFTANLSAASS